MAYDWRQREAAPTLYDTDFAEWADRTAELLRSRRFEEHAAVRAQLRRMLLHSIKQRVHPERDRASWRSSVASARSEIRSINQLLDGDIGSLQP